MKTKSPNLPSSWRQIRIGNLCDLKNGRAFKPQDWGRSGLPIVRIQNLNNPFAAFNYFAGEVRDRFIIENGSLLFAWSGTPGTSFGAHIWRGERAVLNQHIFRVDFDGQYVDKIYFMYAINDRLNELIEKAHGGVGLRHVTKGKFEETTIAVPPLNEQSRIVAKIEELFSELDKGVENLTAARVQLKAYRQSVLKAAFEGKLTENWRTKNADKLESPEALLGRIQKEREDQYNAALEQWQEGLAGWRTHGENGAKPRKPKSLREYPSEFNDLRITLPQLPRGWCWSHLGWCSMGPEYGTAAKSSESGAVPVVRMGNLQNGRIDWSDLVYTSDEEEIEQYSLRAGDVLFNRTNSPELVGKSALYKGECPALFAGYLVRVNQIDTIASGPYVTYFLNSPIAREHGNTVKTDGVNQSNINGTKLQEYPFPFCSTAEQAVIIRILESKLEAVDVIEAEIEAGLARANALRQSILKRAFSGQLVAQDPADEPASIMLERIRAEREEDSTTTRRNTKNNKKEAA